MAVLFLLGIAFLAFAIASGAITGFLEKLSRREDLPILHGGVARIVGPTRQEVKLFIEVKGYDVVLLQANSTVEIVTQTSQTRCNIVSIQPSSLRGGTIHEVLVEVSCGVAPYNSKMRVRLAWSRVGASRIMYLDALVPLTI